MSTIDQQCFAELRKLGLPMDVDVVNPKNGSLIAKATILHDGSVYCSSLNKHYECPSLLRHDLIGANKPTYKYLMYKGKSLKDWGVRRM
jgi:hypothetical protein